MSTTKPNIFTAKFYITESISNETGTATIATNGTKTIYQIEKEAFDALNDFNTKYAKYLRCTSGLGNRIVEGSNDNPSISTIMDNSNDSKGNPYHPNKEGCDNNIPKSNEVIIAKKILTTKVIILESAINAIKNYSGTEYSTVTNNDYTANLQHIKDTHDDIIAKRNEYDAKLRELNNKEGLTKDESPWDIAIQREQEMMFVGTTGAILASALIYYIFSKL